MSVKKQQKPKNKGGRPKIEIELRQVEALAGIQATDEEIAAVLGCSIETIKRRKKNEGFEQALKRGKEKGRTSLRRLQWAAAQGINFIAWLCDRKQAISTEYICDKRKSQAKPECLNCPGAREKTITIFKAGATGMQIWLGKQWLGQQEKAALEHSGPGGGPIQTEGTLVTGEMTPEQAQQAYNSMIQEDKP